MLSIASRSLAVDLALLEQQRKLPTRADCANDENESLNLRAAAVGGAPLFGAQRCSGCQQGIEPTH